MLGLGYGILDDGDEVNMVIDCCYIEVDND